MVKYLRSTKKNYKRTRQRQEANKQPQHPKLDVMQLTSTHLNDKVLTSSLLAPIFKGGNLTQISNHKDLKRGMSSFDSMFFPFLQKRVGHFYHQNEASIFITEGIPLFCISREDVV